MARRRSALDEVVASQHVQKWHERDEHRNTPSEPGDEAHAPTAEDQVDPDQHHGDRMQDAKEELKQLLHEGSVAHLGGGA